MDAGEADYEFELAFASRIAREAGQMLVDPTTPDVASADALQHLNFELSHEPAVSLGSQWISHVDEHIVSIALVDAVHGPVVGVVCRPLTNELIFAAANSGTFVQDGDGPPTPAPHCGMASTFANIVHVPHDRCPQVDLAIEALSEKMPLDVTRVSCCCCCEGLFEVVSGRADAHLSPPDFCYLGQQRTPVSVLCAFEVLLEESGGMMSDVKGNDIDLLASITRGEGHRGGVLASEKASHNYFLNAIRPPFEAERLMLPRLGGLADKLASGAISFRIEHAGDSESIVQDMSNAWTFAFGENGDEEVVGEPRQLDVDGYGA